MLEGKVTDYGDLLHIERWVVKGRRLHFVWRIGKTTRTTEADRTPGTRVPGDTNREVDVIMDLQADKKVTLTGGWKDEMGNIVDTPSGATVTYTVDNADIIALTDNADGTAVAASTGVLGTANVHAVANATGFPETTGDLQIVVVAGDAQRFEITASEPEEVTPDV